MKGRPNLLLVVTDQQRADHVGVPGALAIHGFP